MPEATDSQMQHFCDERLRPCAELFRAFVAQARDDKAAIDDVYARAVGTNRWNDARTDGPPHLLMSGNSANPDDITNLNQFLSAFIAIVDGTGDDATNAGNLRTSWAVLQDACVRPLLG